MCLGTKPKQTLRTFSIRLKYKIKPKKDQIKIDQALLCLFGPQILKSLEPICCVHTLCVVVQFCMQVFIGKSTFYFILNDLKKKQ